MKPATGPASILKPSGVRVRFGAILQTWTTYSEQIDPSRFSSRFVKHLQLLQDPALGQPQATQLQQQLVSTG